MKQQIINITLLVDDYDEAINFYTRKLDFTLLQDTVENEAKRWVRVAPKGSEQCCLLLAKAVGDEQRNRIGNQAGGRVFLFLETDNFSRDYESMIAKGIVFTREPRVEKYGTVAVFADLYGNLWDLIEPRSDNQV